MDLHFTLMTLFFKVRDWLRPPENMPREAGTNILQLRDAELKSVYAMRPVDE